MTEQVAPAQPWDEKLIDAIFASLTKQRNAALDAAAQLEARLVVLNERALEREKETGDLVAKLRARIAELEAPGIKFPDLPGAENVGKAAALDSETVRG